MAKSTQGRLVPRLRAWILIAAIGMAAPLSAQVIGREALVTIEGRRLDFHPQGGWRVRARTVGDRRMTLRSGGLVAVLNAERRAGAANVTMNGHFYLPTVMLGFSGSNTGALPSQSVYDSILYGAVPPPGRPYTLRSYYQELSNGAFHIGGAAMGWVGIDSTLSWVVAPCVGNGGLCGEALRRMTGMFRAALTDLDATVDFGQFDNDGPDDVPNSADDDGVVDAIQFVQPGIGAECGGPAMWAHKSTMAGNDPTGGVFTTDDAAFGGGTVTINSYFLTSGVGGPGCDDSTAVMGIGLAAHEFGHGIGLPDLYDTGGATNGIGEWGLMGSAMYTSLTSPGHFSAWSKESLGWVTLRELSVAGMYQLGPVITGDTVMLVRPQVANPRGEFFLLENRQPVGADTTNLLVGGKAGPKTGGLVVWHIDSVTVAQRSSSNAVNAGAIHGVAIVQADGLEQVDQLPSTGNRGDSGDPFPGDSARTKLSFATTPPARLNHDGSFVGFQLSTITQVVAGGEISFTLAVGLPNVVRASDTLARITVNMVAYNRFVDFLDSTQTYQIGIDTLQTSADGRSRFVFQSWSDGGAPRHTIPGLAAGDSVVASVSGEHRLRLSITGNGTVLATTPGDIQTGVFISSDSVVTLTAIPDSGLVLDSWFGDTNAVDRTLSLAMTAPVDIGVWFVNVLASSGGAPPTPIVGAPYQHTLTATGGRLERRYRVLGGTMPPGLTINQDGVIAGIPVQAGEYGVLVELQSGSQSVIRDFQLNAAAPVLDVDQVLAEVMGLPSSIDADQRRYLDLIGNGNGDFDIGDFLAWIDSLDASVPLSRRAQLAIESLRGRS